MEFETLYKQTFAQVHCPARVAVAAAQPAKRRRFGWVICLAAPLLLAAGVLARVEFTNLHNTPHPSYAPDAVGGYALHYTLTTHPLDTLGETVQTLAAKDRRPAFLYGQAPDRYGFSMMLMPLQNSDLLIHYPNDIEKAEVFTDAADSLQDAAELTNLPLLRNDFVDSLPDGAAMHFSSEPNNFRDTHKRKILLYGTCADGEPFGLNVLDGGLLEKEVSGESFDMYISFNAHAAVTPSGSRATSVEQVLTDGIYDLKDGWTCEEYTLPTGDIAVIPLYGGGDESKASGNTAYFVNNGMIYTVCIMAPQPGIGDARLRPYLKQVLDAFYAP